MRSIRIIDTIIANKKQSQLSWNLSRSFRFVHSLYLFLLSLPFLPSFSSVPPFIWLRDTRGTVANRWVDIIFRYARQITIFYILARWYTLESSNHPLTYSWPNMLSVPIRHLTVTLPFWGVDIVCCSGIDIYFISNHCILYSVLYVTLQVGPLSRAQCIFWELSHIIVVVFLSNLVHYI